jgi:hypothetical protein
MTPPCVVRSTVLAWFSISDASSNNTGTTLLIDKGSHAILLFSGTPTTPSPMNSAATHKSPHPVRNTNGYPAGASIDAAYSTTE